MITNILFQLFRSVWCIEPNYAESMRPLLKEFRDTRQIDMQIYAAASAAKLQAHLKTSDQLVSAQFDPQTKIYGFTGKYPKGSIGIVPLQGAVMKEDFCGAVGTKSISSYMAQIAANSDLAGSILYTDSPGGAALGTGECATLIRQLRGEKPMVTYVDGMECSAAMWIGSSTHYTIANKNDFAIIGSIGTYIQLEDWNGVEGAPKLITIKADASYEKNSDYDEAIKGNSKPLLESTINPLNDSFLSGMSANRFGKGLNKDKVFHGKTFNAQDAIKYGLIDATGTIKDAVAMVQKLSKQNLAA